MSEQINQPIPGTDLGQVEYQYQQAQAHLKHPEDRARSNDWIDLESPESKADFDAVQGALRQMEEEDEAVKAGNVTFLHGAPRSRSERMYDEMYEASMPADAPHDPISLLTRKVEAREAKDTTALLDIRDPQRGTDLLADELDARQLSRRELVQLRKAAKEDFKDDDAVLTIDNALAKKMGLEKATPAERTAAIDKLKRLYKIEDAPEAKSRTIPFPNEKTPEPKAALPKRQLLRGVRSAVNQARQNRDDRRAKKPGKPTLSTVSLQELIGNETLAPKTAGAVVEAEPEKVTAATAPTPTAAETATAASTKSGHKSFLKHSKGHKTKTAGHLKPIMRSDQRIRELLGVDERSAETLALLDAEDAAMAARSPRPPKAPLKERLNLKQQRRDSAAQRELNFERTFRSPEAIAELLGSQVLDQEVDVEDSDLTPAETRRVRFARLARQAGRLTLEGLAISGTANLGIDQTATATASTSRS